MSDYVGESMLGLLGGASNLIGVDLGTSSIKIVELAKKGKSYKLVRYANAPLSEGAIIEDEVHKEDEVIEAINDAFSAAGVKSRNACIGLYGPNTIARKLQIEGGDEEDIEEQVEFESDQYLPFSYEDGKVDYHVVGENEGGGVDVIIAGCKGETYEEFMELAKAAKIKVKIVDLNILALTNVFEFLFKDNLKNSNDSYLILDIGAQTTSFVVYKAGNINFAKEIAAGGMMFTEEIQRQMGVNYIEAEDLKITGDEEGNLPEEVSLIIEQVSEVVLGEIQKTLDFYINSSSDEGIVSCYVTGGAIQTVGFLERLEEVVGLPVEELNPFEAIDYSASQFSDEDINEIIHVAAVAIGLGMRKG